jgi:hypothetical protein
MNFSSYCPLTPAPLHKKLDTLALFAFDVKNG